MATASSPDDIRHELDALGKKRDQLDGDEQELMEEVREVLARAKGVVPITEAADRLHMHRTTIYRVYKPNGNGS
jgi:DNA-binding phage protein